MDHVWNENTVFENASREGGFPGPTWDMAPGRGTFSLNCLGEMGVVSPIFYMRTWRLRVFSYSPRSTHLAGGRVRLRPQAVCVSLCSVL